MFIGIDPGLSGAIGIIDDDGSFVQVIDTPTALIRNGNHARREYAARDMVGALAFHPGLLQSRARANVHVFLEEQHSMPGQGVRSMFTTGVGFGLWLGILAALALPYTRVRPSTWKKELGLSRDKEQSRLRAQQLFPGAQLNLKKHEGRAEALLLAWYGFKELKGERS